MEGRPGSWQGLDLDGHHGWKVVDDGRPGITGVRRHVDLAAAGAEVDATGIERVDRRCVPQYVYVAVALGQPLRQRLPLVAAGSTPIDAQLAVGRKVLRVALDRHDVDRVRLVLVHFDRKAEVA